MLASPSWPRRLEPLHLVVAIVIVGFWFGFDALTLVIPSHRALLRSTVGLLELAFIVAVWRGRVPLSDIRLPRAYRWGLVVWVGAMIAATLASIHVPSSVPRTVEVTVHVVFLASLTDRLRRDPVLLQVLLHAVPIGLVLVACRLVVAWYTHPDPVFASWRAPWAFINVRFLSAHALFGVAMGTYFLLGPPHVSRTRIYGFVLTTLCCGVLLWSGGRANTGALVVFVATVAFFLNEGRRRYVMVAVASMVLGGLLALPHGAIEDVGLFNLASDLAGTVRDQPEGRRILFAAAWEGWLRYPWLGTGPDTFTFYTASSMSFVHNTVLHALTEWGILGTLPFCALLLGALWAAARGVHTAPDGSVAHRAALVGLGAYVALSAASLFDGTYFVSDLTACVMIALALPLSALLSGKTSIAEESEKERPLPRWMRGVLAGGVSVAAAVFLLNTLALRVLADPRPPDLDRLATKAVLLAPTTPEFAYHASVWATVGAYADADRDRLRHWAVANTPKPWKVFEQSTDRALAQGDTTRARHLYEQAAAFQALPVVVPREASRCFEATQHEATQQASSGGSSSCPTALRSR